MNYEGLSRSFYLYLLHNEGNSVLFVDTDIKYFISQFKAEVWYSKEKKDQFKYFANTSFQLPAPQGYSLKTAFFIEMGKLHNIYINPIHRKSKQAHQNICSKSEENTGETAD